ncbi:hypothetical protein D3OALGB2SA_4016 [Olavius algarvensis associated proteobacterium Delta 3]|nr:hypothetical protein D3OALGB2SA_4016 [Olavius algarvensis associated proteobacterium Delta 3]
MRNLIYTLIGIVLFAPLAGADSGMIRTKSVHDVKVTADRLESTLNAKGMRVFIRINHTEGAQKVGKTLRPTEVIIFGNPKVGTPRLCSVVRAWPSIFPKKRLSGKMKPGRSGFHIMIRNTLWNVMGSQDVRKSSIKLKTRSKTSQGRP